MVCYLIMVLVGVSDSLIHNFRHATVGKTFSVIAANLAWAERRSILNAVCSFTILYFVCSGRRNFAIVLLDLANGDVDDSVVVVVFAVTRTNFFEPILISNLVGSTLLFANGAIFVRFGAAATTRPLLQIFVRV